MAFLLFGLIAGIGGMTTILNTLYCCIGVILFGFHLMLSNLSKYKKILIMSK